MKRNILITLIALVSGLLAGYLLFSPKQQGNHLTHKHEAVKSGSIWTCSMHPSVRMEEPGLCPSCNMDLILAAKDGSSLGPRSMKMSANAMRLAEVQTSKVQRRKIATELSLSGIIDYDETHIKTIAAWSGGRLENLLIDATGVMVKKGQLLAKIYSPELIAAQEELLQTLTANKNTGTLKVVREKLRLLGFNNQQIKKLELSGKISNNVEIYAPISGIVIKKYAEQGRYIKTGTPLYHLADLSTVWAHLDVYQSDIAGIALGQEVSLSTQTYTEKTFQGKISFIAPVMNLATRTLKIRVEVPNSEKLLKPNMFVRATIKVTNMQDTTIPLIVPASAVLSTGRRAVVYVREDVGGEAVFTGVEIELGQRVGDYYIVSKGLNEGQDVVTNGNFKIDAALQLSAKPSMMSMRKTEPTKNKTSRLQAPVAFTNNLSGIYTRYLNVQEALAADNQAKALIAMKELNAALKATNAKYGLLGAKALQTWQRIYATTKANLSQIEHATNIAVLRENFTEISTAIISLEKTFGHQKSIQLYKAFCSMANDGRGGFWLQKTDVVTNPYYGSMMLRCGEIVEKTKPVGETK